ncbi:MAG: mevalonate kinase [Candidatus Thermoplasmatota archaeon]|nr:mevalonate kinase [Candidatus Thermoplasmatota archaeon]
MVETSSPAKAILFGEHAVVYGKGAIAISLDLMMRLTVSTSEKTTVNGQDLSQPRHRYIKWAVENLWKGEALRIATRSDIPKASGLGSSAALSCCIASALASLKGEVREDAVARDAFEIEYNTQGRASPTDTSCSAHGRAINVSFERGEGHLWSLGKGERTWHIHHLEPPDMTLVIGFTGVPSVTSIQIEKVRSFYERSGFAKETIDEIGNIVEDGLRAMSSGDVVRIGELMNMNHACLSILGVSSKELQRLKDACDPYSYGVKITGAGGGGSVIALTDAPEKVMDAISSRGGRPFKAGISREGTRIVVSEKAASV